jgi:hypothetical protein
LPLYCPKKNTISPLQVKNKECDVDSEHVFILGSIDYMVVNSLFVTQNTAAGRFSISAAKRDSLKNQHL